MRVTEEDPMVIFMYLLTVEKHKIFQRSEENLYYKLPISMTDAALGAEIDVPTIDGGKSKVKIPCRNTIWKTV